MKDRLHKERSYEALSSDVCSPWIGIEC